MDRRTGDRRTGHPGRLGALRAWIGSRQWSVLGLLPHTRRYVDTHFPCVAHGKAPCDICGQADLEAWRKPLDRRRPPSS